MDAWLNHAEEVVRNDKMWFEWIDKCNIHCRGKSPAKQEHHLLKESKNVTTCRNIFVFQFNAHSSQNLSTMHTSWIWCTQSDSSARNADHTYIGLLNKCHPVETICITSAKNFAASRQFAACFAAVWLALVAPKTQENLLIKVELICNTFKNDWQESSIFCWSCNLVTFTLLSGIWKLISIYVVFWKSLPIFERL